MLPTVVRLAAEARAFADAARAKGRRVGFVPTMGALHEGHLALVRAARARAETVLVSIFVNPTQFGPKEDLSRYPRDLQGDLRKLERAGADAVFAPDAGEMYPPGDGTRVRVGAVAEPLCGVFRPGHFEGVATVVTKLFAIVGPSVAVFGRKDYQQWLVIRALTRDLFLPVEIVGHPIVRDPDGLAMSSRNAYLSPEERARALSLVRGLDLASRRFAAGERRARELERAARDTLAPAATSIDYVEVRDADTLAPIDAVVGERAVLAMACRVGSTRLIDNAVLGEEAFVLPP
ncbi:MAG TPA: pantoate--beta-alanine ligase [Polyangiaceae bacterium]|nr:pantoate--beta-alanine ligase [Polyangiaceae bacterium]